jgi:hypothetical protein
LKINKFIVFNLRETYHELGKYDIKIVLNQDFFKSSHLSDISIWDSDRKLMNFDVKRWGRKINCSFVIDENVADGISTISMHLVGESNTFDELLQFWVIK